MANGQNLFDATDIAKPVPMGVGAADKERKKQALRRQPQFKQESPLLGGLKEGFETAIDPVRAPFAGESKLLTEPSGRFGGLDQWKKQIGQGLGVAGQGILGAVGSVQPTLDYIQHGDTAPTPSQPAAPAFQPHDEPGQGVTSGAGTGVPATPPQGMGGAPTPGGMSWDQRPLFLPPGTARAMSTANPQIQEFSGLPRGTPGTGHLGSDTKWNELQRGGGGFGSLGSMSGSPMDRSNFDKLMNYGIGESIRDEEMGRSNWQRQQAADYYTKMLGQQAAVANLPGGAGFDLKRAETIGNVIGGTGFYSLTPAQQTQLIQEYQRLLLGGGTAGQTGGAPGTTPTTQPGAAQAPTPTSSVPHSLLRGAARGAAGVGGYMGASKALSAIPSVSKALGAAGPWGKAASIGLPLISGYLADWLGEKGLEAVDPQFTPQQPAYAAGMVGGGLGTVMGGRMMRGTKPPTTPATTGAVGTAQTGETSAGLPTAGEKPIDYGGWETGGAEPPPFEPQPPPPPPPPPAGTIGLGQYGTKGPLYGPSVSSPAGTTGLGQWGTRNVGAGAPPSGSPPAGGELKAGNEPKPAAPTALGSTGISTVGTGTPPNTQEQFYNDPAVNDALRKFSAGGMGGTVPGQASTAQATPTAPQQRPAQGAMPPAQNQVQTQPQPQQTLPLPGISEPTPDQITAAMQRLGVTPPPPLLPSQLGEQAVAGVRSPMSAEQAAKLKATLGSMGTAKQQKAPSKPTKKEKK